MNAWPGSHRENNFDLIRLFAALQVALVHGAHFFKLSLGPLFFIEWFPGVPIFFCISGYLIAQSVERNLDDLKCYARSRFLRIYPALVLCVTVGGIIMACLGAFKAVSPSRVIFWYFTNLVAGGASINPSFLRHFGIGVWNGSLWTISVELSFYVLLPVLYLWARRTQFSLNVVLSILLVASFGVFIFADGLRWGDTKSVSIPAKVVWFSLAGNLWMFLFGTLAYRLRSRTLTLVEGCFLWWLAALIVVQTVRMLLPGPLVGSTTGLTIMLFISRAILAGLTLAAAFSARRVGGRLLRGNDISYGLYLWHAPFYNFLLCLGLSSAVWFPIGLSSAILVATISWVFLERKALRFKAKGPVGERKLPAQSFHTPSS